jgi:hypothetical protein
MPLNERYDSTRSKLTSEQKLEITAETLGIRHTSVEHQEENIIDLNKPPVKPYRYEAFPKTVYFEPREGQHPHDANKIVQNEEQLKKALDLGYQLKPYDEPVVDPNDLELDAPKLKKAKK